MKEGRTLESLYVELERQAKSKKDFIAPTQRLKLEVSQNDGILLQGVNGGMQLRPIAHQQLAATLGIPKVYYDRCLSDAPDLLTKNVNEWLSKQPAKKLIRTLDNQVRAILSDSYRPLDNYDLATVVLPKIVELDAYVESGEITESRLYLKAVTPRIHGDVKVGDVVHAGILVSNSEVGQGSLQVAALDYRLMCRNGMIREHSIRKAHLGRSSRGQDVLEDAREFFRDSTRELDDRAFFAKVQDAVGGMFDPASFQKRLEQYRAVAENPIDATQVPEVVEVIGKRFGFNETERKSVLAELIKSASLNQWGLANAITRAAQDIPDYDRSTELEKIGGDVILLKAADFKAN